VQVTQLNLFFLILMQQIASIPIMNGFERGPSPSILAADILMMMLVGGEQ
jgi:hypothetical protein